MLNKILILAFGICAALGTYLTYDAYKLEEDVWMMFAAFTGFFMVMFIGMAFNTFKNSQNSSDESPSGESVTFVPHRHLLFYIAVGVIGVIAAIVFSW